MTANISFEAMLFARGGHASQPRKYTGGPYFDHLAEVAGITAAALASNDGYPWPDPQIVIASAYLHDYIEDQRAEEDVSGHIAHAQIELNFGGALALGVWLLSDLEPKWDEATQTGFKRAERKRMTCARLAAGPGWVQSIKCADSISNISSIVQYDPGFAVTCLPEMRALLAVLNAAHPGLRALAYDALTAGERKLEAL